VRGQYPRSVLRRADAAQPRSFDSCRGFGCSGSHAERRTLGNFDIPWSVPFLVVFGHEPRVPVAGRRTTTAG
jgi:hypothetical protein